MNHMLDLCIKKLLKPEKNEDNGWGISTDFILQRLVHLAFISHLDLQKIIARVFKRSEIKMLYSEGYNMRPLISCGPALGLGISSLSEFFDVRVLSPMKNLKKFWRKSNLILRLGLSFIPITEIKVMINQSKSC